MTTLSLLDFLNHWGWITLNAEPPILVQKEKPSLALLQIQIDNLYKVVEKLTLHQADNITKKSKLDKKVSELIYEMKRIDNALNTYVKNLDLLGNDGEHKG